MRLPIANDSRAVFVGASAYDDARLPDLQSVQRNLDGLLDLLGNETAGGFNRQSITVIQQPSLPSVGITIEREASLSRDTFLLYYAGHGVPSEMGGLQLALPQTDLDFPEWTALDFGLVRKALARCPARNRILIIDCCYSGRALGTMADPSSVVAGETEIEGTYTLTSTAHNLPALAPVDATYTAFTGAFIELLRQGLAEDLEFYPLGRLYPELRRYQQSRGFPVPQLRGTGLSNELALVRNAGQVAEPNFDTSSTGGDDGDGPNGEVLVGGLFLTVGSDGVLRTQSYSAGSHDVIVPSALVASAQLRHGDALIGAIAAAESGGTDHAVLLRIDSINGLSTSSGSEGIHRADFARLKVEYPAERFRLEQEGGSLSARVIDLLFPLCKGQRILLSNRPTGLAHDFVQVLLTAISLNNPECHAMYISLDAAPEEIAHRMDWMKGEVIPTSYDASEQEHVEVAELALNRGKRLVELGQDVVIVVDSLERLGEAYFALSQGSDTSKQWPRSHRLKSYFGAGRKISDGGSLTLVGLADSAVGGGNDEATLWAELTRIANASIALSAAPDVLFGIDVNASNSANAAAVQSRSERAVIEAFQRETLELGTSVALANLTQSLVDTRTNVELLRGVEEDSP